MGKWCLHASLFIFDRIIIKVAGNQGRHKSSVEFDLGQIRPLILELLTLSDENFTLLYLNISEVSWPILIKFYV